MASKTPAAPPAPATCTVEMYVMIDADGNTAFGESEDDAVERYQESYGSSCIRCVKVVLDVPLPTPTVIRGTVPVEQTDDATLTVA